MACLVKLIWFLLAFIKIYSSFDVSYNTIYFNSSSSLEYCLCHSGLHSNMTLTLSSLHHYNISSGPFCLLENLTNVTIQSDDSLRQVLITCSAPWRGFGFFNISNLHLIGLTFHQCGGPVNLTDAARDYTNSSSLYLGPHQRAVLLFSYCHNTSLTSVSIRGPYGGIGIILINVMGITAISNILVSNNMPCSLEKTQISYEVFNYSCSGSGLAIVFTDRVQQATSQTIIANNITVTNNANGYAIKEPYTDIVTLAHQPIITAAGISIMQSRSNCTVVYWLHNLSIANNFATYIAGFVILDNNRVMSGSISLTGIIVENNYGRITGGLGVYMTSGPSIARLALTLNNSLFFYNHGQKVGAADVNLFTDSTSSSRIVYISMYVYSTRFIHNEGYTNSSCLNIESVRFHYEYVKLRDDTSCMSIIFSGVSFTHHHIRHVSASFALFLSGVYYSLPVIRITNINELIIKNSNFTNNAGPVFDASNSLIKLEGNNYFLNNIALTGSCFNLKSSQITFYNTHTSFYNNKAITYGGAIYSDMTIGSFCPFIVNSFNTSISNIKLHFVNNTADLSGNAIYASNLYSCHNNAYTVRLLDDVFDITPKSNLSISSTPAHLCHCNEALDCLLRLLYTIYPGQVITLSVIALDAAMNPVFAEALAEVVQPPRSIGKLVLGENIVTLSASKCNKLNFTVYLTDTIPTTPFPSKINLYVNQLASYEAHIIAKPCPLGFVLSTTTGKCECSHFVTSLNNNIQCDIHNVTISLPLLSWFGVVNVSNSTLLEAFSTVCHINYCHPIALYDATNYDSLCQYGRTGIMCGQCPSNTSTVFGSDQCLQCSNIWLLSIAVYAVVGLLLVLVLFRIKLTVSAGTLGGLIFFANMAQINVHDSTVGNSVFTSFVNIAVSLVNLNIGFPVCFYSNMSAVAKIGLQFVFPVYLWLLVFILVIASRHSVRLANMIASSSVQVLATLVQLSFAKLLSTVTAAFTSATVSASDNSSITVWYHDGNMTYLKEGHLVLFLLSAITTVIILLPYLVFTTIASQLHTCHRGYRIRPLIDAYHGPYKDKLGFWFGVRQWMIVMSYGLYAGLRGTQPLLLLSLEIITLMIFCIVQAHLKPFKNKLIGILDMWFILLLITLDITTLLFISSNSPESGSPYIVSIEVLYLLTVIVVIIHHTMQEFHWSRSIVEKAVRSINTLHDRRGSLVEFDDSMRE